MKISEKYIDCNGLRVFYREMGAGPVLILFHGGWATGHINWSTNYKELAKHFRIISPDHRGHGNTSNPDGKFSSFAHLAWDMIGFIEALNLKERPLVMGHSSGAMISLHISVFQPKLIARQVLISIHPHIGVSEKFRRGQEEFFGTDDYRYPPKKWRYMLTRPIYSLALWWAHKQMPWYELLHAAWPMWIKPPTLARGDYSKIRIPTLVIIGEDDEFGTVEEAKELAQWIKGSQFETVAGAKHMFVVDAPEKLQALAVPFLRKARAG